MVVNLIDILFTSLRNYSEALCDVYKVLSLLRENKSFSESHYCRCFEMKCSSMVVKVSAFTKIGL